MVYIRHTGHGRLRVSVGGTGGYGPGMVRVWGANLFSRPFSYFKNIKIVSDAPFLKGHIELKIIDQLFLMQCVLKVARMVKRPLKKCQTDRKPPNLALFVY